MINTHPSHFDFEEDGFTTMKDQVENTTKAEDSTFNSNQRDLREKNEGSKRSKYLVFLLDGKQYGIALSSVKEVIGMTEMMPVPHSVEYFKGLINLRGKIHSIIDLRLKLNLKEQKYFEMLTSIIICEIGDLIIGMIVDNVEEVICFEENEIERHLRISGNVSQEYIAGVARRDDVMTLLLNVDRLLTVEELQLFPKSA